MKSLGAGIKELFFHISVKRRWQLAALLIFMIITALTEMATLGSVVPFLALISNPESFSNQYPWIVSNAIRFGFVESQMLYFSAILFTSLAVIGALIRILFVWISLRISFGLGGDIGVKVYSNVLYQPYSWHLHHNSSEVLSSLEKVNSVVGNIIVSALQGGAALVIACCLVLMLILINPATALISGIVFVLMYGLIPLIFKKRLASNSNLIATNLTSRLKSMQEGLGGIRDIILDSTQSLYAERFSSFDYTVRRCQADNTLIGAAPRYVVEACGMIMIVVMAIWLSQENSNGLASAIPILGALAIGAQKLLPQMQQVYSSWSAINGNSKQLFDVLKLMEKPEVIFVNNNNNQIKTCYPSEKNKKLGPLIKFSNVSFHHGKDHKILSSVNIEISYGMKLGIIGKTGSGKSTLVDLMMGLLEPTEGLIQVDGKKITSDNVRDWQKRIAHVPQNIFLKDGTIAENIALGLSHDEIDKKKLFACIEQAQLLAFIEDLPDKHETTVGERGIRLSGGQRQRIGLARAFYKQADVLIFDEATSALDNDTERMVINALWDLNYKPTVIMIAHRLSTLYNCDHLIEMDSGSIISEGNSSLLLGYSRI